VPAGKKVGNRGMSLRLSMLTVRTVARDLHYETVQFCSKEFDDGFGQELDVGAGGHDGNQGRTRGHTARVAHALWLTPLTETG
jgi:hypothetical protein